jgi:SIR2-like protein
MKTEGIPVDDALPRLSSLYQRGVLVPFIGSGMSVPVCCGWDAFISALTKSIGVVSVNKSKIQDSRIKYQLADKAVGRLASKTINDSSNIYRSALRGSSTNLNETFTEKLATLYWPLAISTNYDDVYLVAARLHNKQRAEVFFNRPRNHSINLTPEVMGRSEQDCLRVLRSLDKTETPLLWAVQGYLGGIVESPESTIPDLNRRIQLASEIVVGHQQYQRAINSEHHFRRAFAEVCRRRSLLFLGSGIAEDYLLNLFSEVIHHHGPSPYGHYALFPESHSSEIDSKFLSTRLGVVPVFYAAHSRADYAGLGKFLERLSDYCEIQASGLKSGPKAHTSIVQDTIGFAVKYSGAKQRVSVQLSFSPLPGISRIDRYSAYIVSLGRETDNTPKLGLQAKKLLPGTTSADWQSLDPRPSFVYRNIKNPQVYGLAARDRENTTGKRSIRALASVSEALFLGLTKLNKKYESLHIGALASDHSSYCHPIHTFVQMLRGLRRVLNSTFTSKSNLREITIHIADPEVWTEVLSGKISILNHLSSDIAPVTVEVRSPQKHSEFFTLTVSYGATIGEILDKLGLISSEWTCELLPPPDERNKLGVALSEPVLPTMTLRLTSKA